MFNAAEDAEFQKLKLVEVARKLNEGDTVVVASGLIGRGYDYIREQANVVLVGSENVLVEWKRQCKYDNEIDQTWIDKALIVEHFSIKQESNEANTDEANQQEAEGQAGDVNAEGEESG